MAETKTVKHDSINTRVHDAAARIFPATRDGKIENAEQLAEHLYLVDYTYTHTTGPRDHAHLLVFDDEKRTIVFKAV